MRKLVLIIPVLFCLPLLSQAQQPPATPNNGQPPPGLPPLGAPPMGVPPLGQPGGTDPASGLPKTVPVAPPRDDRSAESEKRLDEILDGCSKRLKTMDAFYSKVELKEVNALTRKEKVWAGEVGLMKPNLFKLNVVEQLPPAAQGKTPEFQRIICTEKYFYIYSPKEKIINTYEIPQGNQGGGNVIMDLLKGMNTSSLRQRFDIKLGKEDQWYAYVDISPKFAADQQDFIKLQLVLWLKNPVKGGKVDLTSLPCRIYLMQPNKNEQTLSFPFDNMIPNAPVNKAWFVPTKPTPEWEIRTPATPALAPEVPAPAPAPKK